MPLPSCIVLVFAIITSVQASVGDNLAHFKRCITHCELENCSSSNKINRFEKNQPTHLKLLGWTCEEECKYSCQWTTINFLLSEIQIDFLDIPQFYGKWTFYRIFGIQEPASAIFSLCNLIATYLAWTHYCRTIFKYSHTSNHGSWFEPISSIDPYFVTISLKAILAINAWIWSFIFHVHDTPLTEKMDYFSAFSVVLFSFFAIVARFVDEQLGSATYSTKMSFCLFMPFLSYYIYHIYYLIYVKFDYGFNMKANLVAGFSASFLWLYWAYKRLSGIPLKNLAKHHVTKCVISILLVNLLLVFELNDFPPIFFMFDTHSIWHFGTISVPFLLFRFYEQEALKNLKHKKE